MNTTKKAIAFVIILFLVVAVGIIYIFSELYTESEIEEAKVNEDAIKFKDEYEKLNDVSAGENHVYRNINIDEDNPFIYSTDEDIVKRIDNKETFVVYFGFNDCPWCRSVMEPLLSSAKDNEISSIYYVDVKSIRDTYVLDEKHTPVRSIEGSKGYYDLLDRLDSVLDDYADLTYTYKTKNKKTKTKAVKVEEKRIYAPTVIIVKDGIPIVKESGMVDELTDPYMEINDELKASIKSKFDEAFKVLNNSFVCTDPNGC